MADPLWWYQPRMANADDGNSADDKRAIDESRAALAEEVGRMATEAVGLAERFGVTLDFSEASVDGVEEVLVELVDHALDGDAMDLSVQRFGCYLLEVGRRAHGGYFSWWDEREAPVLVAGEPECKIGLLTWDKVRGRLGGDPADEIPFFYAGFARRAKERKPGDHVTYV